MSEKVQRIFIFVFGCILARLTLVYVAYRIPIDYLQWMGVAALGIAIGFTLIFLNKWRKTGIETRGRPIWWNHLRPIHALFWFTFAILALLRRRKAWIVLLLDTLVGLGAFLMHITE